MKRKLVIYSFALIAVGIALALNLSGRRTHGITGATFYPEQTGYIQLILLALLFLSAILHQKFPRPYFRYGILIFSIIFLGFYKKTMLTTGHILNISVFNLWPLRNHLFIYTLLVLTIITTLIKKDTYCNYCCPFGAIQQLVYRISPFKLSFNAFLVSLFRKSRYIILWLILIITLLSNNFRIATLDPFATMFSLKGTTSCWLQISLILGFSLLYYRIWCFHFCPVGAAVSIVGSIPRIKKVFSGNPVGAKKDVKDMFKSRTTYLFLVVFLLLTVVTLSIVALNLKKGIYYKPPPPPVDAHPVELPSEVPSQKQKQEEEAQPGEDSRLEQYRKYGIEPKEARYYE